MPVRFNAPLAPRVTRSPLAQLLVHLTDDQLAQLREAVQGCRPTSASTCSDGAATAGTAATTAVTAATTAQDPALASAELRAATPLRQGMSQLTPASPYGPRTPHTTITTTPATTAPSTPAGPSAASAALPLTRKPPAPGSAPSRGAGPWVVYSSRDPFRDAAPAVAALWRRGAPEPHVLVTSCGTKLWVPRTKRDSTAGAAAAAVGVGLGAGWQPGLAGLSTFGGEAGANATGAWDGGDGALALALPLPSVMTRRLSLGSDANPGSAATSATAASATAAAAAAAAFAGGASFWTDFAGGAALHPVPSSPMPLPVPFSEHVGGGGGGAAATPRSRQPQTGSCVEGAACNDLPPLQADDWLLCQDYESRIVGKQVRQDCTYHQEK